MIIQLSAIIDGITAKKDRTLSIKLGSQELEPEEMAKIFEHQGHQIWVAMAEHALKSDDLDIPEVVDELDNKTPSKRFRDRLAVYYKGTKGKGSYEGFEIWYRSELEKLGQLYLDKLD